MPSSGPASSGRRGASTVEALWGYEPEEDADMESEPEEKTYVDSQATVSDPEMEFDSCEEQEDDAADKEGEKQTGASSRAKSPKSRTVEDQLETG